MSSLSLFREIAASPERVWRVVTDLEHAAETLSGVTRVEMLTEPPYRVGTRWRETRTMMGREETQEMWVTTCEEPHRTAIEAVAGGVRYLTTFTLTPSGTGARLTMQFEGTPTPGAGRLTKVLAKVTAPLALKITRKVMESDLDDIARTAETGGN